MTLDEWMRRRRLNDKAMAAELKPLVGEAVHFYTVTRWRRFMCIPPRGVIDAIAHLTAFAVMPNDWYPEITEAREAARAERALARANGSGLQAEEAMS